MQGNIIYKIFENRIFFPNGKRPHYSLFSSMEGYITKREPLNAVTYRARLEFALEVLKDRRQSVRHISRGLRGKQRLQRERPEEVVGVGRHLHCIPQPRICRGRHQLQPMRGWLADPLSLCSSIIC